MLFGLLFNVWFLWYEEDKFDLAAASEETDGTLCVCKCMYIVHGLNYVGDSVKKQNQRSCHSHIKSSMNGSLSISEEQSRRNKSKQLTKDKGHLFLELLRKALRQRLSAQDHFPVALRVSGTTGVPDFFRLRATSKVLSNSKRPLPTSLSNVIIIKTKTKAAANPFEDHCNCN